MRKVHFVVPLVVMAMAVLSVLQASAADFPFRSKYPDVATVETADLHSQYASGSVVIVDVRSKIEYEVIHPKGAVHLPVSKVSFAQDVGAIQAANAGKSVAFYCNGVTCLKSYEAAKKAGAAGLANCFAYDAGIPDWANNYPKETLLLGEEVVNPQQQLISKADFKKKALDFETFKAKAAAGNAIVIDARDHIQSSGKLPGLSRVVKMPFDALIPTFIKKKRNQDKTLLIFDQVGKQVRWLEYYLVKYGYSDYFFLAGGATKVLGDQKYK